MAFDVGAIVGRLELKKGQWDQSIRKVKGDQKSLSGMVLRNSQQFKQMGRSATIAGTAIVGTVGVMVHAFATFDHAMNESLAIMGDVSDEMKKDMADAALAMSTKTIYSAKELAKAYFFLASAGMDAAQSIKALPVVAKFAQAGAFDLATATDLLTDAQTALGLSSKDAVENQRNLIAVSDVLVKANTLANASVLQFSEALTNRAAASLVNVNKTMEEGVAVLAAYADKGVKGQKAGMRLSMMLNALDVAAMKNTKAWEENGLALFDENEEMRSIGDLIGDLEVKLGTMTTKQKSATLAALGFNVRTKASILTLMGSSEKIKQWEKDLKNAGGTTEEVAKKQLQSLVNQFTILKNQITEAAISVGKTLGPALKDLVKDIKNTVSRVAEWIKEHPKLTGFIAKSALAIGGLLMVLGPLMMMLPGLVTILPVIKAGFLGLLGPLGVLIVAITTIGFAINKLINNYKDLQDAEMDAILKASTPMAKSIALRKKLISEEIVSVEEWREIYDKHGRSHKRVLVAMANAPEYAHIREKLEELKKQKEELGASDDDLLAVLAENSEEVVKLTTTMIDEIMKATLNEFEYRKWTAQQTYEERKALLEAEKADKEAFILLERTLALELDGIEKDKTQKFKDGWAERGRAVMAGLLKWQAEEKKYSDIVAGYIDIRQQFTLNETEYKLFQLDTWYDAEVTKLWDLYGESARFYEAKEALDAAYTASLKGQTKTRTYDQMSMFEKIGTASMMALGQSKAGAVTQAIMSTYAGAAKTIEMLGMPFAIPFVALAILTGLKQVAEIRKQEIPSAQEGALLTHPTLIEAGHGEEIISPVPMMRTVFEETLRKEINKNMKVNLNFYGPLISTTGLSYREVDEMSEYFLEKMKDEVERLGEKLNG